MLKIVLLVLLSEIFSTIGQVFMKKGSRGLYYSSSSGIKEYLVLVKTSLSRPSILWGFLLIAISLIVWIVALTHGDLSLVFPIGSIQYLLVMFAASFFLNERIDRMKLAGTLLIAVGIVLLGKS